MMLLEQQIYLRRCFKVLLPVPDIQGDRVSITYITTLQKNITSLGFRLPQEVCRALQQLGHDQFMQWALQLVDALKVLVGAHQVYRPMYHNFPAQVMNMRESELYWNALTYYWSLEKPDYETLHRSQLKEMVRLKVLDTGSDNDWLQHCQYLLNAKVPFSEADQKDVQVIIHNHHHLVCTWLPPRLACKENLAFIAVQLFKVSPDYFSWFAGQVNTATDVLRFLVAWSAGDVSLATSSRIQAVPRRLRLLSLSVLEQQYHLTEDLYRYPERWKRVGERLHPGEYKKRFPRTAEAFCIIRNGQPVERFNRQVEQAFAKSDLQAALTTLKQRPGELARRLDHLLRCSDDQSAVLDTFHEVSRDVSTAVLLQVMTHFEHRHEALGLRVFFPKGQVAKVWARRNTLPGLTQSLCHQVVQQCENALLQRFSAFTPLGKCYLDDELTKFLVPFSHRSASKALHTVTRGSQLAFPDGNTLRFFIWWKNGRGSTDIDLSAAMFDTDYRYIDTLAYYNLKNFGAHHSGDIVDAPDGAAEFIDIDIQRCLQNRVRYVVMCINSYSRQPYIDLPECFAGWMQRQHPDSGEIFEPRTVVNRLDITADTIFCLPAIFDLEEKKVIWADIALDSYPHYPNNVANNLSGVSLMLRAVLSLRKLTLYRLFELHIRARGQQVDDITTADTVFSVHDGITPFNSELIVSQFL